MATPSGGGAVRPIAEKFAANPATGSGGAAVGFALPAHSRGLTPSLGLSYDTGAGLGPFGLGWSLDGVPQVTRKTDKGLPRYADGEDGDTFVLAGAEDLVPELVEGADGWVVHEDGRRRHYRPRTEGAFSRIVAVRDDGGAVAHWEVTDKDNVTHIFGRDIGARVADPKHGHRVFTWLLERSEDALGNVVLYQYKAENLEGVALSSASEAHRRDSSSKGVEAQKYLKRVLYGNRRGAAVGVNDAPEPADFHFEVVFDYGEHADESLNRGRVPRREETRPWDVRPDCRSSYRSRFEVRTYRRCTRVLVFHRFDALEGGAPTCVHETRLTYEDPSGPGAGTVSYLSRVEHVGYGSEGQAERLPPARYRYSTAETLSSEVIDFDEISLHGVPAGVDGRLYQWVDLNGEGAPGVLTQEGGALRYKQNLGRGELGPSLPVGGQPSTLNLETGAGAQLVDITGDGLPDVVDYGGTQGFYARSPDGEWLTHRLFGALPLIRFDDPHVRLMDLSGDGSADIIASNSDPTFSVWMSLRAHGFDAPTRTPRFDDARRGPHLMAAEPEQAVLVADMSGDGLQDLVVVQNGAVGYYPNLGYGAFGARVQMDDAPWMDRAGRFDPSRVRLADVDGSGPADLLYVGADGVSLWRNRGGNGFSPEPERIAVFPGADPQASVDVIDLLGSGTACLVWSTSLPGQPPVMRYVDLHRSQKPHLLVQSDNGVGLTTQINYTTSTRQYFEDLRKGITWSTRVPFPVHVVASVEHYDAVARHRFVSTYRYRDGHYDGVEREFRGFGYVEQRDAESVDEALGAGGPRTTLPPGENGELPQPPVLTKTWFHTGAMGRERSLLDEYAQGWWPGDADRGLRPAPPAGPRRRTPQETFEAARALRGQMLRQEVYAEDGAPEQGRPYVVTHATHRVHVVQPALAGRARHAVFLVTPEESVSVHTERAADAGDARVSHELTLATDELGRITRSASIAYGRTAAGATMAPDAVPPDVEAGQRRTWVSVTEQGFSDAREQADFYRHSLPKWTRQYELLTPLGAPRRGRLYGPAEVNAVVTAAPRRAFDTEQRTGLRLLAHQRTVYWREGLTGPDGWDQPANRLA
ncbi:MAG: SpvB/TcaC N-terminal domain-containing protein, partial [Myxococcota bacterium]